LHNKASIGRYPALFSLHSRILHYLTLLHLALCNPPAAHYVTYRPASQSPCSLQYSPASCAMHSSVPIHYPHPALCSLHSRILHCAAFSPRSCTVHTLFCICIFQHCTVHSYKYYIARYVHFTVHTIHCIPRQLQPES
jgi:hypothetical protein